MHEELTPAAKEKAEADEKILQQATAASRALDSLLWLTSPEVDYSFADEGFYIFNGKLFSSHRTYHQTQFLISDTRNIMISREVLINALVKQTDFTIEHFRQVFNSIPPVFSNADPAVVAEQTKILLRICAHMSSYKWETRIDPFFPAMQEMVRENLAKLRIPASKNGLPYKGYELLLGPVAGEFKVATLVGMLFRYEAEGDPSQRDAYAVLMTDHPNTGIQGPEEMAFNVRIFLGDIMRDFNLLFQRYMENEVALAAKQILADYTKGGHAE